MIATAQSGGAFYNKLEYSALEIIKLIKIFLLFPSASLSTTLRDTAHAHLFTIKVFANLNDNKLKAYNYLRLTRISHSGKRNPEGIHTWQTSVIEFKQKMQALYAGPLKFIAVTYFQTRLQRGFSGQSLHSFLASK